MIVEAVVVASDVEEAVVVEAETVHQEVDSAVVGETMVRRIFLHKFVLLPLKLLSCSFFRWRI